MEGLRKKVLPPLERLHQRFASLKFQPTGKDLAGALRDLWGDLDAEQQLQKWGDEMLTHRLDGFRPAVHVTVWEQMNSWLDNVQLAFCDEPMPLREWLPVLEAGLANLTVGLIPATLDEVLVGAVDRARNPDLKFALVLGVNETVFPAAPARAVILTGTDRDDLDPHISLVADLRERLAREHYYGYIALTRASQKLVLAFSRRAADGAVLNPSPFVTQLKRLFPGLEIADFHYPQDVDEAQHESELVPWLLQTQCLEEEAGSPSKSKETRHLQALPPATCELLKGLGALCEPVLDENISAAKARELYGEILKASISRLEEFAKCPFKFFVGSGLRAQERKIFELDARERGSFQHDVLKVFHEQLEAENKRWRDLTPQQARERIASIASALAADFRGGLLRDSAQTQFAARAMAESLQDFIAVMVLWMHAQYEFDPAKVELEFGQGDAAAPAWEIALSGGRKLELHGRIDRVDLCCRPDNQSALMVVLDYKSGAKRLDPVLVQHGVQMQLLAYLGALRHLNEPRKLFGVDQLLPAGVFYVNLRGRFDGSHTRGEVLGRIEESRREAYRHTGRFDEGALDKLDSAGAEDQFNYKRNWDGTVRKGSEALSSAQFDALLNGVEEQLRNIGNAIYAGSAEVDPYRKWSDTPCDFCEYQAICRIDPLTHRFRLLAEKQVEGKKG